MTVLNMTNNEILAYLQKFEQFSPAKIQRFCKWGNTRAIAKTIELVDLGLIYELPDQPMLFKIESSPQPRSGSFENILKARENHITKN